MSVDQTKLTYQFILVINAYLHLVDEHKKKAYSCYTIGRAVSKMVKK